MKDLEFVLAAFMDLFREMAFALLWTGLLVSAVITVIIVFLVLLNKKYGIPNMRWIARIFLVISILLLAVSCAHRPNLTSVPAKMEAGPECEYGTIHFEQSGDMVVLSLDKTKALAKYEGGTLKHVSRATKESLEGAAVILEPIPGSTDKNMTVEDEKLAYYLDRFIFEVNGE